MADTDTGPDASMARQRHWDGVYNTKTSTGVSWYQDSPRLSLAMIEAAGLRPDAPLVDVGGGASTLVDGLLGRGFTDVTVLDVAESALVATRRRLGPLAERVSWVAADVTRWRSPRPFDLWHDRALFHFLTGQEDRDGYRRALEHALARDGQVVMATFAPDGPERCSGLPVVRYGPEALAAALGAEFSLVESRHEDHATPAGVIQKFVYCRFRRR